ncbi:hypothetical protein GCM10007887_05160 [Methylobacterium haplocladii]|nr:hypothetical protein GCM10007887_05160 [Methylobacterium haplocladii]
MAGLALLLPLSACGSDPDGARNTAERYGFRDVVIRGYAPLRCSELDAYATAFVGRDLTGTCRRGVVCGSPFGASAVRDVRPSDACSDVVRRPAHLGVIR